VRSRVVVTPVLVSSPMLPPSGEGSAVDHPEDPSRNSSPFVQKAAKPCTLTEFHDGLFPQRSQVRDQRTQDPCATLEILRGKDPDPVKFGLVGTCGFHSGSTGDCPWIEVRDRNYHVVNQKGEGRCNFPSRGQPGRRVDGGYRPTWIGPPRAHRGNWVHRHPALLGPLRLLVQGHSHGRLRGAGPHLWRRHRTAYLRHVPVWIRVYPNFSWKGDLWMGYEYERNPSRKGRSPRTNWTRLGTLVSAPQSSWSTVVPPRRSISHSTPAVRTRTTLAR